MPFTQPEQMQVVTCLREGNHNGVARSIADYVDRRLAKIKAPLQSSIEKLRNRGVVVTVTRSFDVDYVIDATKDSDVIYTIQMNNGLTILASSASVVVNLTADGALVGSTQLSLTAVLSLGATVLGTISGRIPAGAVARLSSTTSSNSSVSFVTGQEKIFDSV